MQVSWLKNGGNLNLIAGDISGRIGMTLTFELFLSEINYGDAGTYTCQASNANGDASNSTVVTVVGTVNFLIVLWAWTTKHCRVPG